ncbi:uncharacterized protein METZ01_LOCUS253795, partial [marine metagenome]
VSGFFQIRSICVEKKRKLDRSVRASGGKTLGQEIAAITVEKLFLLVS